MLPIKIRRSTVVMAGLVAFLAGLAYVKISNNSSIILINICFLFVNLFVWRNNSKGILPALYISLFFCLGCFRGLTYIKKLQVGNHLVGQSVTIEVTAREDAVYSDRKQLIFSSNKIEVLSPKIAKLTGNIEVEGFGVPMVYRGDRIKATGRLFSKRGDNQFGISFASLQIVHIDKSSINKVRRRFTAGLQNVLPEPLASFSLGLLIGQRNTLPKQLKEQLTSAGLIHIVAVSGYNLTIIVLGVQRLLQNRSRYQVMIICCGLIVIFLLLTGYSPSIIRAAIVSIIGLVMWYYGRNINPLMILLLSAVLTAGVNPMYLWSSVGWYLSFTAFFGVLIIAPLFSEVYLTKKWRNKMFVQVLVETTAAQLCTLPLILFIFGRLSFVGIVANMLVIPLVPLTMLMSFISGIYGMIAPITGGLIALPAKLLLQYIVSVAGLLSSFSYSNVSFSVSAVQMVILYIFVMVIPLILLARKRRLLT